MQAARVYSSMWRNAITQTARRNYGKGQHRLTTMNDMPVPEGDFMTLHAARQRIHHTVLAIGVVSCGFGLFLLKTTGLVNFHYSPPDTYE